MPEAFELEITAGPSDLSDRAWLDDDAIEFGPPPREWAMQLPNWLDPLLHRVPIRFVLAALVLGLAIAAGISATKPSPTAAVPAPFTTPIPSPPDQSALTAMVAVAESPTPLANFVINDDVHPSCPAPTAQRDPAAAIAATVLRYQPSLRLRDSGVGSEITGDCSAQLRFTGELGATVVVTVLAPPNTVTPFVISSSNDRSDAIDIVMDIESWRIEIGMIGQPGTVLDQYDLVALGSDARLRWA